MRRALRATASLLSCFLVLASLVLAAPPGEAAPTRKRIAFIIDSWHSHSHPDVIGRRFLDGYRLGNRTVASSVTVASVFADSPRPADQTRALAARYGFRVAGSVAEALLEDVRAPRPRLIVDGIFLGTREEPAQTGQHPSPTPRLQVFREVLRVLDQAGAKVPIFLDKMVAANWADAQAIVAEASRRGLPLMAGSVLPYTPMDRPVRADNVDVAVAVTGGPYWAYAFHTAEFLQGFVEQRTERERGVSSIREAGSAFATLPDRERWGGRLFDALVGSGGGALGDRGRVQASVLLIQYVDGTRAVLAVLPRLEEGTFLLAAGYADGSTASGRLRLQGEPFDHFGYLVHALAEFYTTARPVVPVERTLLTTGIVLLGQQARESRAAVSSPSLAVSYMVPRR